MSLKTFVKVGHVTNLSDARYCAGMEVDLIGFCFDGQDNMTAEKFEEISGWLSGVKYVGEFNKARGNEILEILGCCALDYVQINEPGLIDQVAGVKPVILKWDIDQIRSLPAHLDVAFLLLEGGSNQPLDQETRKYINKLGESTNILLGTGFSPDTVEQVLDELNIHGIAMKGSDEIRPGYKDYDELADILEMLEEEN